jgi:hypothetical protein
MVMTTHLHGSQLGLRLLPARRLLSQQTQFRYIVSRYCMLGPGRPSGWEVALALKGSCS